MSRSYHPSAYHVHMVKSRCLDLVRKMFIFLETLGHHFFSTWNTITKIYKIFMYNILGKEIIYQLYSILEAICLAICLSIFSKLRLIRTSLSVSMYWKWTDWLPDLLPKIWKNSLYTYISTIRSSIKTMILFHRAI